MSEDIYYSTRRIKWVVDKESVVEMIGGPKNKNPALANGVMNNDLINEISTCMRQLYLRSSSFP